MSHPPHRLFPGPIFQTTFKLKKATKESQNPNDPLLHFFMNGALISNVSRYTHGMRNSNQQGQEPEPTERNCSQNSNAGHLN